MNTRLDLSFLTISIARSLGLNPVPRRYFSLIALALTVPLAFSPSMKAACQQGCEQTNTFLGEDALVNTTFGGFPNTAVGYHALYSDTTGYGNSAIGNEALLRNTDGIFNAANGSGALYNNISGDFNTASGAGALYSNTNGLYNTADGFEALHDNLTGSDNTAVGFHALYSNATGFYNTALGAQALFNSNSGLSNTAVGVNALFDNTAGDENTACGTAALFHNTEGAGNVAIGLNALFNNSTGSGNIALGDSAGLLLTSGDNNIYIGNKGVVSESDTIRIGKKGTQNTTFIAGISGSTVANGAGVIVGSNGKLGTIVSSERYKDGITPMGKTSEAILALQPVTFRYKAEVDPDGTPQFGLVAEDVARINRNLVVFDEEGRPYTVRYEAVNAMLLNEFLKEHKVVQDLKAMVAHQNQQIDALTIGLQKVSARIECSDLTPQVVLSNP